MLWNDLREYIAKLDELGELKTIRGASWEEEIGGISELIMEQHGPALLFEDIPGYPTGYRVAVNLFGSSRRTAVALGIATEPTLDDLAKRWLDVVRKIKPIPPRELTSGPILQNVMQGDDVDLFRFPTPQWHENDGGRYIGTGVCVINKDPDTGHVNSGSYRVSIQDKQTCGLFIERDKGADVIRRKFWARGEKCPVVISVGQDPILTALGGPAIYQTPADVSELAIAGFLQGEPYPVVKAPITGLPMPANAEIVIEGFIPSPTEAMMPEGPFGEWTGYYAHGRRPETIVEVAAIYYRDDPIIFGSPPVRPLGRTSLEMGGEDIGSHLKLDKADVAGVKRVYYMGKPNLRVVAIEQQYPGHVDDVVKVLVPEGQQYYGHQIWVLVDDDVDVTNNNEVLWAIASRCAPEEGVTVVPGTAFWQLDPRIRPDSRSDPDQEQGRKDYRADHLVINACRPYDWKGQFPPVNVNGPELRQRIRDRWAHVLE